jgi:hypothetical protein
MILFVLALVCAAAPEATVTGSWGADKEVFFELKEGGKGKMDEEPIHWEVKGSKLVITDSEGDKEEIPFKLKGDRMTITVDDTELVLHRVTPPATPPKTRTEQAADQVSKLLLSSAWCSKSTRMQFFKDGSWSEDQLATKNKTQGQWVVKEGGLHISYPPLVMDLTQTPFEIVAGPNNSPIVKTKGEEYSLCR